MIDQINSQNLRRTGSLFVPIDEIAKDDYIPTSKKLGIKQSLKFKQQHKLPVVLAKSPEEVIRECQLKLGEQEI